MSTKRKLLMLCSIMILMLNACGQNKLVNRWTAVGHLRNGKLVPENNKDREYEFLKNGSFKLYKNGMIEGSGTYVLASDSKSILLKDGNQSGSLRIMKLTSTELVMIFNPGSDTILFYPHGSATAKQAVAKADNYNEVESRWHNLERSYEMWGDLVENLTMITQNYQDVGMDRDHEIFTRMEADRNEINAFTVNKFPLKEEFERYESLQEKYSKDFADLLVFIKKYPKILETQTFKDRKMQLSEEEKGIKKAKADFIVAFNKYHGKEILFIK